ncbi:MAG: chemotaxis protein CheX [Lysobacter sp.]|nr:chemotaxis protein CheX [Lysobacter sp.]
MAAAKFFGQFLLERGVIDASQLLRALDLQRASNPMLGEIAQAEGLITIAQARMINERQRREDRRFGDIAQELHLLTAAQVDDLVEQQKRRRRLFGEILVEEGMLDRATLETELAAHQADRAEALSSLARHLDGHPLQVLADGSIATCAKLFLRILKTQAQFSSLAAPRGLEEGHPLCAYVQVDAARPLGVALACDAATATAFTCAFLSLPPSACDEALARDALGELANVLMGYVVKDALPEDMAYRPKPPTFLRAASELAAQPRTVAMAMTSQLGPFALLVGG